MNLGLLGTTLQLFMATAFLAVPVAMLLSHGLARHRVPFRRVWETCLLLALFIPLYIHLAGWEAGLGRRGWYSTLISQRLSNPPLESFRGAVLVHAVASLAWLFWLFRLGLATIPRELEEAARLDASPLRRFVRVTLPLSLPALIVGVLYLLIVASTEITVTDRYQVRTYAEVLYSEFVLGTEFQELPLRIAPMLVLLVSLAFAGFASCRLLWPRMQFATSQTHSRNSSRRINWWFVTFIAVTSSSLILVPMANLIYHAGIDVQQVGNERQRYWSFAKLTQIVVRSPWRFRSELAWTAVLAQLTTLAAVGLSIAAAWWSTRGKWQAWIVFCLGVLCFVTPGPLIGLSIIWLLNRPEPSLFAWLYDDTLFAPWLALTVRTFPFACAIICFGLRSIPTTILDAARLDAPSPWKRWSGVVLPMLLPSIVCAITVSLAVSIGDVSASTLVMPPGVTTVAGRIFDLIHYGAEGELAGLCLTCMFVMGCIAFVARMTLNWMLAMANGVPQDG